VAAVRRVIGALVVLNLLTTLPAYAQIADAPGPGEPVARPASQCPQAIGCQYAEAHLLPTDYLLQSLQVCGANCTSQYWIAAVSDGHQLLATDPVRGGAVVAVQRTPGDYPPVRVVMAMYGPNDPGCCPSAFSDTTYTWDPSTSSLVAGDPNITPADQFAGYEATRNELSAEGWIVTGI
jgi:hypothetical protein